MSWRIERRTFLRGTAGALLPLPFLNLMESAARGAEADAPPLRFVTLFKPNGVHPPSWNISGGTEHDFRMSPLMKPFERHKADLLILDNMGDFGFSSHANSTRRFLSGHHENQNSASIDQLIADKIGGDTPHRSSPTSSLCLAMSLAARQARDDSYCRASLGAARKIWSAVACCSFGFTGENRWGT